MANTGKRRSKAKKARDKRLIGELYLQGLAQLDIADRVGVSQSTVSNDLLSLRSEWLESALMNFNERKAQELAKLDRLELEYWRGWLRSCEDEETKIEKVSEKGVETTTRKKGQAGDSRFLDGIEKCIKRRCDILGVEAAKEHQYEIGPKLAQALEALPGNFKVQVVAALQAALSDGISE